MPEITDYSYKLHKYGDHVVVFHLYRATTGDYPRYSQYVNSEGKWYIMKESESGSVRIAEYYMSSDSSTIDTDWTNRADKTYGRLDSILGAL